MFISCLPYLLFLHLPSATGTASSGRLTVLDAALFLDLHLHKLIISVNNSAVHYQTIYTSGKKKKSLDVFLNSSPLIPPCKLKTSGWTKKNDFQSIMYLCCLSRSESRVERASEF